MIPSQFDYQKASSAQEALDLISGEEEVKLLAGGHSLVPVLKLRLDAPAKLVDIGQLKELNYIKNNDGVISIGAVTTHHDVENSADLKEHAPALARAASVIGDVQVRNRGTIGGSLAHADPAADYPGALMALNATVVILGAEGKREISASNFFIDLYETALQEGELLLEVRVPSESANRNSDYLKFPHPASRYPIVGCAVAMQTNGSTCEAIRVAYSGVGNATFRDGNIEDALVGKELTSENITLAVEKATESFEVLDDTNASEDYRRHLCKVFAKKAITQLANPS